MTGCKANMCRNGGTCIITHNNVEKCKCHSGFAGYYCHKYGKCTVYFIIPQ